MVGHMKRIIKIFLIVLISLTLFGCKKDLSGELSKREIRVKEKDFQKVLNNTSVDIDFRKGISLSIAPDINVEYIEDDLKVSIDIEGIINLYYNITSKRNTYLELRSKLDFDLTIFHDDKLILEDEGDLKLNLYLTEDNLYIDYQLDSKLVESNLKNKAREVLNQALYNILSDAIDQFNENSIESGNNFISYLKDYPFKDLVFYKIKRVRNMYEIELNIDNYLINLIDEKFVDSDITITKNEISDSKFNIRVKNGIDSMYLDLNYDLGLSINKEGKIKEVNSSGNIIFSIMFGREVRRRGHEDLRGYHVNNSIKNIISNYVDEDLYEEKYGALDEIKNTLSPTKHIVSSSNLEEVKNNKHDKLDEIIDRVDIESLLVDPFKITGDFEIYSKGNLKQNKHDIGVANNVYDLLSRLEFNVLGDISFYLNSNSYNDLYSVLKVGLDIKLNDNNSNYRKPYNMHIDFILYMLKDKLYVDIEVTGMGGELKLEFEIDEDLLEFYNSYINNLDDYRTSITSEYLKDIVPVDFTRIYENEESSHLEVLLNSYFKDYFKSKEINKTIDLESYLISVNSKLKTPTFYDSYLKFVVKEELEKVSFSMNFESANSFELSLNDAVNVANFLYDGNSKFRLNLIMDLIDVKAPSMINSDDLEYFYDLTKLLVLIR